MVAWGARMRWPLYFALAALALGAALAGLRESAAVPWFMVAVGLAGSVWGLRMGLAAAGLTSLLLFFQGAMDPSSLAALLLGGGQAHLLFALALSLALLWPPR